MTSLTGFKHLEQATNQQWFSIGFTSLRITLGVQFLWAGIDKLGGWSASGFLSGSTGPFAAFFQSLAGNVVVDQLNVWGLILIGLALIVGIFVRPAAFFSIILMGLYYLAHFEQNTAHGLIDSHIIYIFIAILFLAGGAGHVFGVDGLVFRQFRKPKLSAKILFG